MRRVVFAEKDFDNGESEGRVGSSRDIESNSVGC